MKKILCILISVILLFRLTPTSANNLQPDIDTESAILIEAETGQIIYEKNPDEVVRPASITKIMTLLLIFDAIEAGKISMSDNVTVSAHAASMGGSQVFLEEGEVQTVETMIKCIAIASANDACVAMAEFISGTEEAFVDEMNNRAKALSMNNTHFVNSCGLDAEGHVTTARDVSLMSRELINNYPSIHDISTIWMDTITHITRKGEKDFVLNNTNKLLKQYEWATGLKTGSTSLAGFCLASSAEKNGLRLISVIMGAPTSKIRISDSITLLNYGYSVCDLYEVKEMPPLAEIKIKGTIKNKIRCRYQSDFSHLFTSPYDKNSITYSHEYLPDIKAPITEGDVLGQISFYYNSDHIGSVDIVASESAKKSQFKDYFSLITDNVFSS